MQQRTSQRIVFRFCEDEVIIILDRNVSNFIFVEKYVIPQNMWIYRNLNTEKLKITAVIEKSIIRIYTNFDTYK